MSDLARFTDFLDRLGNPLRHFAPRELLYLGNNANRLNHTPPDSLWPNIVATALYADLIRHEYGHPLRVISAYRSPQYNASLPNASPVSQHLQFRALDLMPIGRADIRRLHEIAVDIRTRGPLRWSGGIGVYESGFIHIDNRGENRDWSL